MHTATLNLLRIRFRDTPNVMDKPTETALTEEQWKNAKRFQNWMHVGGHDISDEKLRKMTERKVRTGENRVAELISIRVRRMNVPPQDRVKVYSDISVEWGNVCDRLEWGDEHAITKSIQDFFAEEIPFLSDK